MAFTSNLDCIGSTAVITLAGDLDGSSAALFRADIERAAAIKPQHLILKLDGLTYMASAGLRALIFAKQQMGPTTDLILVATPDSVLETIRLTGFDRSCTFQDAWNPPSA